MLRIMVDAEFCDGCMKCVKACEQRFRPGSKAEVVSGEAPHSACFVNTDQEGRFVRAFCRRCPEPACRITCMSGAIKEDPDTGRLCYDKGQCAACFMCVMNCPYGMPKPDPDGYGSVIKCDFCPELQLPACVKACDQKAIYVAETKT